MEEFEKLSKVLDFHSEVTAVLSQKKNLYNFFANYKKMLLPDNNYIDIDFLIKVLEGKKKLISLDKVSTTKEVFDNVTVSTTKLQKYCWDHKVLQQYVPDCPANKEYLVKLMSYLDKPTLDQLNEIGLIQQSCANNRLDKPGEALKLKVCEEFANILLGYPAILKQVLFKINPLENFNHKFVLKFEDFEPEKREKFSESDND